MAFTSDPQTIADLVTPVALDDMRAFMMAVLAIPANKITDWESGAVLRTMMEIEAEVTTGESGTDLQNVANNGYPGDSTGDSETQLAHGWYAVDREETTCAQQNVLLACDAAHGPYVITAGHLGGLATDGIPYIATTGGTINPGGNLTVTLLAQTPGQARGLVSSLLDAFPGVTVIGAAIAIVGGVAQFGSDGDDDATVTAEMAARFPDPDVIAAQDRAVTWAVEAVPTITRSKPDPDETYPGGVVFTFANASGGIPSGDVTTVQDAFDAHAAITDVLTAQGASDLPVDVNLASGASIVYCPAAILDQAKVAADASWTTTLNTAAIGGKVYLLSLVKAVMDAVGPTGNFVNPGLVGADGDGDGNVTLGSTQVPVTGVMPSALDWVAI